MKELRFWQGDWWRQKERIRWAATIGLALLLVAGGVYIDRAQARQEAAEQAALAAQAAQEQQALAEEREEALAQAQEAAVQAAREAAAQAAAAQQETTPSTGESETSTSTPSYGEDGQPRTEPEVVTVTAGPLTFVMPVDGEITRGYGYDYDPTTEDYRFHRGVDLAALSGTPVLCAAAGKITAAAEDAYWGGIVTVDHGGGWTSAYRGLEPAVQVGDAVEAGTVLGHVCTNIPAEAAQSGHIHVELALEGDSVDPSAWL